MNGVSLWLAMAAVGVTGQVEQGPGNVATYTIRIESVVLDQLRRGEQVTQNVAVKDRHVRRFRILGMPERNVQPRLSGENPVPSESLVQYEAVWNNNEVEMLVQIAPERVETLVQGRPIEGVVPVETREIHRYVVFVGMNQLPSQQPGAASPNSQPPPHLLTGMQNSLAPASAESRTPFDQGSSRATAPTLRTTPAQNYNSSASLARGVTSNAATYPTSNDPRTALRNSPDQSLVSAPPADRFQFQQDSFGASNSAPGFPPDGRFNQATGGYAYDQYDQRQQFDRQQATSYGNVQYSQPSPQNSQPWGQPTPAQQQQNISAARPDHQFAPTGQFAQAGQLAQTSPLAQAGQFVQASQFAQAGQFVPTGQSNSQADSNGSADTRITRAAAPSVVLQSPEDVQPRSSTPLILTTLALFTSLGVNAYLGWLAYSFFWRYRDAVNDSLRARSHNAPGRQAA